MAKKQAKENIKSKEKKQFRPPIVTIMGHVDHGKTTLLDAIRETNLQSKETGGMTQSIGAYQVNVKTKTDTENNLITFIDTPGHEAFTAMRARGAQVTDIVLLVVAANDGVKPQTVEAINHAKAAGVPIIVVINKIDVAGANAEKVKEELSKHEIISEEWGGDTIFVEVSAKNKTNLEELLTTILLVAEMEELIVSGKEPFSAPIIESHLDSKKGPTSSIIVKTGILKSGDTIFIGEVETKVRNMMDEFGKIVKEAGPSKPVEIIGLKYVPSVGDIITKELVVDNIEEEAVSDAQDLDTLFAVQDEIPEETFTILLKSETQGSLEAVIQSLQKIEQGKVTLKIVHQGVGPITESDVLLAKVSSAHIVSFRVKGNNTITNLSQTENVTILYYDVIYKLIEEIEAFIQGKEKLKKKENVYAEGIILAVFERPNGEKIAGVKVTVGSFKKGQKIRVRRNDEIVFESKIKSMRHVKENINQLKKDMEGGITFDSPFEFQADDILEVFSSR